VDYDPTTPTSGNVIVTITANKTIQQPAGRSGSTTGTVFTKTYMNNTDAEFTITDTVGNTGTAEIHINYIDKTAPTAINLTYNPSSYTNTGVEVTLETSEWVYLPAGRNGNATGTMFTKTYATNTTGTVTFYDHVYNQ
jgi:hypothetical protein